MSQSFGDRTETAAHPVVPAAAAPAASGSAGFAGSAGLAGSSPGPAAARRSTGPRRVRLAVTRLDPWSVMKTAFIVTCCLALVFVIAVAALYVVLDTLGVFSSVQQTVKSALNVHLPFSPLGIIGGAGALGLVNVIFSTALATIGAFIYNVAADLAGGVEVTLTEPD